MRRRGGQRSVKLGYPRRRGAFGDAVDVVVHAGDALGVQDRAVVDAVDVLGATQHTSCLGDSILLNPFHAAMEIERKATMDGTGLVWVRHDGANSGKIMAPIGPIAAT